MKNNNNPYLVNEYNKPDAVPVKKAKLPRGRQPANHPIEKKPRGFNCSMTPEQNDALQWKYGSRTKAIQKIANEAIKERAELQKK